LILPRPGAAAAIALLRRSDLCFVSAVSGDQALDDLGYSGRRGSQSGTAKGPCWADL